MHLNQETEFVREDPAGGLDTLIAVDAAIKLIVIRAGSAPEDLRAVGDRVREEFSRYENAVAMNFDDAEAARDVRRGSRHLGEERVRAALRHQRAMYIKHGSRGAESFVIYADDPAVRETLRYPAGRGGATEP